MNSHLKIVWRHVEVSTEHDILHFAYFTKVKHELRVQIHELQVQIHELED